MAAAVILMVSLLGMGALQSTAMKRNTSAMNKVHAMEAASYIGDAIKSQVSSNPDANQGVSAFFNNFSADYWGENNYQSHLVSDCGTGCGRNQMIQHMLAEWEFMIGESLPRGQGLITPLVRSLNVDGNNVQTTFYEVTIMWDDRQMAQNNDGSDVDLGTGCSGNPSVDLTCMKTFIQP